MMKTHPDLSVLEGPLIVPDSRWLHIGPQLFPRLPCTGMTMASEEKKSSEAKRSRCAASSDRPFCNLRGPGQTKTGPFQPAFLAPFAGPEVRP